jgi:hypothetical protein
VLPEGHALSVERCPQRGEIPDIQLRDDWVWRSGRQTFEFHGPDKFYWHGRAVNAYDARYHGWVAWLKHKGAWE